MSNSYYNHGSYPTTGAPGTSASMRSQFDSITSGFNLLPTISGNGSKAVVVNSGATALTVTTGTLALAGNFATTGAYNTTLIQGATTSLTLPLVSGTLATLAGTEEFTNKTLTSAIAKGTWTTSGTWTLPALTLGGAITYGGVTLSNAVTGTGNMVLSASPTLTGTIAAASQTLSGTLGVTGVATFTAQPIMSSLTASKPVFTDASKGLVSTGTLAYDQGGTGQTSYAAGDIVYASGVNTLAKLTIGTTGQRLVVAAGLPSWATDATIGTVTSVGWTGGIVSVATATTTPAFTIAGTSGGIPYFASGTTWATSAALTQYGVVYGGGAGAAPVATAAGTTGQILQATTGGAPVWGSTYAGTVTSVAQSFTGGLISVAGSPITTSGTLALTVAGTSGGIPYFASASTWATSAALTANALMIGGGAGAAPATTTTGTGVVTALGVNTGTAGAFVVNGGALGTPASGTVTNLTGTASININGTVGNLLPADGAFTTLSATGTLSGGTSGTGYSFSGSAPATSLTLDSSGNLGLGVTPSAWGSGFKAVENQGGALYSGSANANFISQNFYFNGTNNIYKNNGFASAYSQNSGVHAWFQAASGTAGNPITFTQAMTLDASGNLLVGGTSNSVGARAIIENATGSQVGIRYTGIATYYLNVTSGGDLGFSKDGTERMRIDSSGNLLVGTTTSPGYSGYTALVLNSATNGGLLDIQVAGTRVGSFQAGSATELRMYAGSGVASTFYAGGSERMRLDSSGSLGLGVTPSGSSAGAFTQLQIGGGSGKSTFYGQSNDYACGVISAAYFNSSSQSVYAATSKAVSEIYLYNGSTTIRYAAAGTAGNTFTPTNIAVFSSTGLAVTGALSATGTITSTVGNNSTVFTAASATTGHLLLSLINGSGSTYVATTSSTGGLGIIGGGAYASTFGSTTNTNVELITNNTVREIISGAGAFKWNAYGAGALTTDASGNITAASDERAKTNIRPFLRGAEALREILPILHGYTEESLLDQSRDDYAGFSAQNVQKYIPEAVGKMVDGMLTLNDRPITAALVNAFRELDARITALEAK